MENLRVAASVFLWDNTGCGQSRLGLGLGLEMHVIEPQHIILLAWPNLAEYSRKMSKTTLAAQGASAKYQSSTSPYSAPLRPGSNLLLGPYFHPHQLG